MEQKTALVAGATGLVGSQLVQLLLDSGYYGKVYLLSRRKTGFEHPVAEELIIDFDLLTTGDQSLPKADDVYCCLGTTMKKAGSKKVFRKVDFAYPAALGLQALNSGAAQYLLVSAMGASKKSYFFYNRVKGEVEENVSRLSAYQQVAIFRPSLLLGERPDPRFGEKLAEKILNFLKPLMLGPLRQYRPIHARTVAKGMLNAARQEARGVHIYDSEEIKTLAGEMAVSHS
jgi:uncharacterized protein YbjT (DUF2867 family)